MEAKDGALEDAANAAIFRGVVAERSGEATPGEWKRLSLESPLVRELLLREETLETDGAPDGLSMGALLEMRQVMCTPVRVEGSLRGVVFAGARNRQAKLKKTLLEGLAAELATAAQLQEYRDRAEERRADIVSATRLLTSFGDSESVDVLLAMATIAANPRR